MSRGGRTSRRRLLVTLAALLAAWITIGSSAAHAATLDERVGAVLRRSGLSASTSVYVWDQSSRDVIYTHAAGRRSAPASTMKLLTSAAALARFGPGHRFSTRVALTGHQEGTRWIGSVWLVGGGDPSLSTGGFARDNYGGRGANIATLVAPLRARGITEVSGRLYVDGTYLDDLAYAPDWPRRFRYDETGALGGLTVNQSLTGRWVGTRSSRDPDVHAGTVFRRLLLRGGIRVRGGTLPEVVPPTATTAGELEGPPLRVLLAHMNRESDNFYAETLLKDIGRDRYGAGHGSTKDGRRAARAELAKLGIDMDAVTWKDGSGLSYDNRVSVRALGHVLGVGAQATWGPAWTNSFARSGRHGTLAKRMRTWPYRDRVRAKTGTLRNVSALAGFADRLGSDRRFGFAVITWNASGAQVSYTRAKQLQDRVAMVLVR